MIPTPPAIISEAILPNPLVKGAARIAYMRERYQSRVGVPVVELLPVTRREIKEETKAIVSRTNDDNSIEDEETSGFASTLVMDAAQETNEKESAILLEKAEKRRLVREVDMYRWAKARANNAWLIVI